jgi:hypothetical protein
MSMEVRDMFPAKYLRGQDMTKPILVELRMVEPTELRAGPDKPAELAFLAYFENVGTGAPEQMRGLFHYRGKGHALVLRKSLAEEIMQATSTTDTDQWTGKRVVLFPEQKTVARRTVVSIRARAQKAQEAKPAGANNTGGK